MTAVQGKGYYVNAQDTEMLREQHVRKVEDALMDAISFAKIAKMSDRELVDTLKTLQKLDNE